MDPPAMSRKFREEQRVLGQMPSYIRPLGEGIVSLRALMKSALPLLNKTSTSKAASTLRILGSRSVLSCHQLAPPSHRAVRCLHLLSSTHRFLLTSLLPVNTIDLNYGPNHCPLRSMAAHLPRVNRLHGSCQWL